MMHPLPSFVPALLECITLNGPNTPTQECAAQPTVGRVIQHLLMPLKLLTYVYQHIDTLAMERNLKTLKGQLCSINGSCFPW